MNWNNWDWTTEGIVYTVIYCALFVIANVFIAFTFFRAMEEE